MDFLLRPGGSKISLISDFTKNKNEWSSSFNPEVKKFDLNCKTWNSNFEWTLTEDDFCIAWYDCDFCFQATTLTQNYNVRVIMSVWHPLMLQRIGKHHSCAQMEQFLINSYSHVIGGKSWNYIYKIENNFYMKFTDDLKVQMWEQNYKVEKTIFKS